MTYQCRVETLDLINRLRTRASIRRQITTRKSVQEGKPDRLADLLDESANEIERMYHDSIAPVSRLISYW